LTGKELLTLPQNPKAFLHGQYWFVYDFFLRQASGKDLSVNYFSANLLSVIIAAQLQNLSKLF